MFAPAAEVRVDEALVAVGDRPCPLSFKTIEQLKLRLELTVYRGRP